MKSIPTRLDGPLLIEAVAYGDERGFFVETFRRNVFAQLGVAEELVQDNHSRSRRGVVRGMHFQPGMGKLVRCARGAVLDVVVDIRRGSPAFGEWESFELSDGNQRQVWCPNGFAHGFCVVSEVADVIYGCTDYWNPQTEAGFRYDDPEVAIAWPAGVELIPSGRDAGAPRLAEIADTLH